VGVWCGSWGQQRPCRGGLPARPSPRVALVHPRTRCPLPAVPPAGQEECLICYSIIQPTSGQLPRLCCRTCRKRFHGGCLYKWFKSSGKSNCPHCQSPW
jgi:hypothetical protein